jgi:hypothetical protein
MDIIDPGVTGRRRRATEKHKASGTNRGPPKDWSDDDLKGLENLYADHNEAVLDRDEEESEEHDNVRNSTKEHRKALGDRPRVSDPGVFSRQIVDTRSRRPRWPSRVVRGYFGDIVARTLNRWKNDPRLGFPRPTTINGRDYYDPDEIENFALRLRAVTDHEAKKAENQPAVEIQANNKPAAEAHTETCKSKTPSTRSLRANVLRRSPSRRSPRRSKRRGKQ